MLRSTILAAIAVVMTACASVTPATTPTPVPTSTPTAPPSPSTAPTATTAPTASATPAATSTPAATATPSGAPIDFGPLPDTIVFIDDFSDPASGWGAGTASSGTVGYVDGALQFDVTGVGSSLWSRRQLGQSGAVVGAEADLVPSALGFVGILCGASDDELWGAVVNAAGLVVFVKVIDSNATVLATHNDPAWAWTPGEAVRTEVDCSGASDEPLRLRMARGEGTSPTPLVYEHEAGEGPAMFNRVAIYSEASDQPFNLRADNLTAYILSADGVELVTWATTATEHRGQLGQQFTYFCPAAGDAGTVWGTDVYTDDSSVCTAAVHRGLITFEAGGQVTIEMRAGRASYEASTRNGVTTNPWGNWSSSFVFVTP